VSRSVRRAAVAVAFGALAYFVVISFARPFVGGDTPFVLDGTNAFITCLREGVHHACGFTGKLNYWGLMSGIGWWPLLQHIPDLIAIGLGADGHAARTRVLAALSVVGVVVSVGLGWLVLKRYGQRAWFWGFLFIALSGPILAYGRQTAGEMLAMGLLVGLVAATTLRAPPPVVGLAALGACLTKETSYPFVAVLGLLGLVLARRRDGRSIRPHVLWGVAGMAVTITAASLFNEVRFGSVLNTNYLDDKLQTPGLVYLLDYVAAVFWSPSGGLVWFWPAAVVLLAAACLIPLVTAPFQSPYARPALVLFCVIGILDIGFAAWWTPFGWTSYGPRLQVPWMLPLVLLSLVAYGDLLARLTGRLLRRPWRAALVFAVALACALPHIGYMWDPDSLLGFWAQENPPCNAPWRSGLSTWHSCQTRLLWTHRPMPLYTLDGLKTAGGAATAVIVGLGLAGSLVLLRAGLGEPQRRTERMPERPEAQSADLRTVPAR
jgi:hypothetical protein